MATEDGFYHGYFIPKGAFFLLASVQLIDPHYRRSDGVWECLVSVIVLTRGGV